MANVARGNQIPAEQPPNEEVNAKKKNKKDKGAGRNKKEKKGMTPLRAGLIAALFFMLLLTVAFALVFFNIAESRTIALSFLQLGEHPYQNQMNELVKLQESIRLESVALGEAQQALDTRESDVSKRERDVTARENALADRSSELDDREQFLMDTSTELKRLVEIYEKLTPAKAANILQEMNNIDEVTRILNEMKPNIVSDILSSMDVDFAARVSFAMLGE